jgi:hypothetical protein
VVQLATHRTQTSGNVAQALTVSQLSEGHGQIPVAAREASVVRIAAITLDTLLELVRRQAIHELRKDSLADIHPSLSVILAGYGHSAQPSVSTQKIQIEKCKVSAIAFTMNRL